MFFCYLHLSSYQVLKYMVSHFLYLVPYIISSLVNLWFIGFNFALLWSSSVVNLGGYEVSLYACLRALFWIFCSVASLLLDSEWVGNGGYFIIGSTSCLYRYTLVLAFAAVKNLIWLLACWLFYVSWVRWNVEMFIQIYFVAWVDQPARGQLRKGHHHPKTRPNP